MKNQSHNSLSGNQSSEVAQGSLKLETMIFPLAMSLADVSEYFFTMLQAL